MKTKDAELTKATQEAQLAKNANQAKIERLNLMIKKVNLNVFRGVLVRGIKVLLTLYIFWNDFFVIPKCIWNRLQSWKLPTSKP